MKITRFEVDAVTVPMEAHRTASGVVTASPLVLLRVHTDAGVVGSSMLFTFTPAAQKPCADLIRNCEALVVGQVLAPAAIWDALQLRFRLLGTEGIVGMALSGIDMALWDAFARGLGLPLYAALGATPRPVRYYGSIGFDGPRDTARAAESWARRGATGVKAKIGYPTLEEDIAVIRAMRAAVGPQNAVMVDYNQSLDFREAKRRLHALDAEGLHWIEEPVTAHDHVALVQLSELTATPLQAGENWWGPTEFRQALSRGVRELLMTDVMKTGGVTGWMRVAAMAQAHAIDVSSHLWPEISAQLLLATPTASWLEYIDWWSPLLKVPLQLQGAHIQVGEELGTGIEFDPQAVAKYRV